MKEKFLNIGIPEELHREFKSIAARHGTTMKDLLVSFIHGLIKNEKYRGYVGGDKEELNKDEVKIIE